MTNRFKPLLYPQTNNINFQFPIIFSQPTFNKLSTSSTSFLPSFSQPTFNKPSTSSTSFPPSFAQPTFNKLSTSSTSFPPSFSQLTFNKLSTSSTYFKDANVFDQLQNYNPSNRNNKSQTTSTTQNMTMNKGASTCINCVASEKNNAYIIQANHDFMGVFG